MKSIYGKKVGMTRIFSQTGECVPVTVLELGPNVVHQVKTEEKDGYSALQVGFGKQKPQRISKALKTHLALAKKGFPAFLAELRFDSNGDSGAKSYSVGDSVTLGDLFSVGDLVNVRGTTMGKGFAGVMKRHGMKGAQTVSHGTHEFFRHGGSIGCRKWPGRVFKNKRMAGHMGVDVMTQRNLEVVEIRPEENLLLLKGSVPGPKNGRVLVSG